MMKTWLKTAAAIMASVYLFSACGGGGGGGSAPASNNTNIPVLDSLTISGTGTTYIDIAKPVLLNEGSPTPQVKAYIGLNGTITASGSAITGYIEGPVDVSSSGYHFTSLNVNASYKIFVVASNSEGYSVKYIIQSTGGIAPVLNPITTGVIDASSIEIKAPSYSTAGNPSPQVKAYIGYNGTIKLNNYTVTDYIKSIDVTGDFTFSSLESYTQYRIIIVATNTAGSSVQEVLASTAAVAPVLGDPKIQVFDSTSITIEKPSFATIGNPVPSVLAYIGLENTIAVSGTTVTGQIASADVSGGSYQFTGLSANTSYKIIIVAQNIAGDHSRTIIQSTDKVKPVLNNLSIEASGTNSITLSMPTFSVPGNPSPVVMAYIGLEGTITVSGTTVTGYTASADVSSGSHQFTGLTPNTSYKIIVTAVNAKGSDVKTITACTDAVAPMLNNLVISGTTENSIAIERPSFSVAGNPAPDVKAYIGLKETISVSGTEVTGNTAVADVSLGGYNFSGLEHDKCYTIIVVAKNIKGSSVKQIDAWTVCDPDSIGIPAKGQTGTVTLTGGTNSHGFNRLWHIGKTGAYSKLKYFFQNANTAPDDDHDWYIYFGNSGLYVFADDGDHPGNWYLIAGNYSYNSSYGTFSSSGYLPAGRISVSGSTAIIVASDSGKKWDMFRAEAVTGSVSLQSYNVDPANETVPDPSKIDNTISGEPMLSKFLTSFSSGDVTLDFDITAPGGKLISSMIFYIMSPELYAKCNTSAGYYNSDYETYAGQYIFSGGTVSTPANRISNIVSSPVYPGNENGTWYTTRIIIRCTDNSVYEWRNEISGKYLSKYYYYDYSSLKFKETGVDTAAYTITGNTADTAAPLLNSISISSGSITYTASKSLKRTYITLSPKNSTAGTVYIFNLNEASGGTHDISALSPALAPGDYYISHITLKDMSGNTTVYYGYDTGMSYWSGDYSSLGLDFSKMIRYTGPELYPDVTGMNTCTFTVY